MARRHPEAIALATRERAAASSETLDSFGWRWNFGWSVVLVKRDGSKSYRNARSYEKAKNIRDHELLSGPYECAWIRMKSGRADVK